MESPGAGDGILFSDIPTRPMRVKVLYTFDYDNKTNCLARFPDTLQIPAVAIDENSQVGVIELRQCIQAIVSASPELLSRLAEGDFTIYAYDYSEYETPLVGQGMLSVALAAASPTPLVPAHQSKTMITGRVCKNLPALFSNGVKETLEVKLRLVPVPKQVQNEYIRSMESLRSMSPATSAGFDPNAWTASLNINNQQGGTEFAQFDSRSMMNQGDQSLMDEILGFGRGGSGHANQGGVGTAQTPSDAFSGANPAFSAHAHSAPGSRAGSPMMGPDFDTHSEHLRHQSFSVSATDYADQSRPDSRASVRSESYQPMYHQQRQASTQSLDLPQQTEIYYNEDGQPRKRAKVIQADWRGRSSFGKGSSDLRVTASTAASMQLHRPIATRPSAPGSNLEPPPRVPTPVPHLGAFSRQRGRQSNGPGSLLRQASTAAGSDFMSDIDQMSEAVMSSPEDASPDMSINADGTPQELPSSPPVFPGINQPTPSSPGLPTLPPSRMADSGYLSERNVNSGSFFENLEFDSEDRSPDAMDYDNASKYQARNQKHSARIKSEGPAAVQLPPPYPSDAPTSELNFEWERPGDMNRLPHKMLLNLPPGRGREKPPTQGPKSSTVKAPSRVNSPVPRSTTPAVGNKCISTSNQALTRPTLHTAMTAPGNLPMQSRAQTPVNESDRPQSRRGSLALPNKRPAPSDLSDSVAPPAKKRRPVQRSQSVYLESEAGSPAPSDAEGRPSGTTRSGSGAQRHKKMIEQKKKDRVAQGLLPQFCAHCGSIDTPTWRNLYFKLVEGKPGPLDYVQDEGETVGVEPLEWDEASEVSKFVIRKSMKRVAARMSVGLGFEEIQVCNPCGLWFNKNKFMRPRDKWGRKSYPRKLRGKRTDGTDPVTDGLEPQSEAFFTDAVLPEEGSDGGGQNGSVNGSVTHDDSAGDASQQRQVSASRPRAHSMQAQQRPAADTQWGPAQRDAALARAIQSSPVRFQGSQESPIELEDLTPRPTRRQLFPSPRRDGESKSLDDNNLPALSTLPSTESSKEKHASLFKVGSTATGQSDVSIFEAFTMDKENMPPPIDDDDDLAHLFAGSPSLFNTPGKTPRKTPPQSHSRTMEDLLKTPTPASRKLRKHLTPSAAAANNATLPTVNSLVHDFMTSPSSSRYFLRSTPTRLANTPGRRSGGNDSSQQVSPFSRHLAQMLNNATTGGVGEGFTSPSVSMGGFDFSDLPTFNTPGRQVVDWEGLMGGDFGGVFEDGGNGL